MDTKEGLVCGALRVMMESQVCRGSLVNQDLQDIRHIQEAWDPRWLECWMENQDLKAC